MELIIGGKTDPAFGKVITFGLGGTLVELMCDVSIKVLPIGENSMRGGVKALRDDSIPNFSELEEAFRAVGKALGWKKG